MTDQAKLTQQALNQAAYIGRLILPVTERTAEARKAILSAVASGDLDATVTAISENRALWIGKLGKQRGVMTPEVKVLAENWLAKVDALIYHGVQAARRAA